MLGQNVLGKYPLGRLYNAFRSLPDTWELPHEFEQPTPTTSKPSNPVHYTVLGRHKLGRYALASELLQVDTLYMPHEFEQVTGITQVHNVLVNDADFEHVFTVPSPSQAQSASVNDMNFPTEFEQVTGIVQVHIRTPNDMEFPLEFEVVQTILPTVNFPHEFEQVTGITQVHNIQTVNDFRLNHEFENVVATQVHVVRTISEYQINHIFDQVTGITQVHNTSLNDMQFDSTYTKIFPEVVFGGYMFVTVTEGGNTYKLSFEGLEDDEWWTPGVVNMPALELTQEAGGGYQKPSWGQITLLPDTFASSPPRKADVSLDWGLSYTGSIHVFDGTLVLRRYDSEQLDFDVFEPEYEVDLLSDGTDENGDDTVQPAVFGTVSHMRPQRTGTDVEQRYYLPDFAGIIGSGINAYDDGVLINDSWTDNGDGTVSRSVDIVGELTFSGTGSNTTLIEVFTWGCSALGLTLDSGQAESSVAVDAVIKTQQYMLDFLSSLAWYCDHGFYIREGTLYLISNDADNGSQSVTLSDDDFDAVRISYTWPQPVKKMAAEWQTLYAITDADSSRMETEDHDVEVFSSITAIGAEQMLGKVYNMTDARVRSKLEDLISRANQPRITLEVPLYRLPDYGERIDFTQTTTVNPATGYVHVREVRIDHAQKIAVVSGDGEVNFT